MAGPNYSDARCKACRHPERAAIDAALVDGTPEREVGRMFGLSPASTHRHRAHVEALLTPAPGASSRDAESLRERVGRLVGRLEALADGAYEQGNGGALLACSRELIRALELLGKATGELRDKTSVPQAVSEALGATIEEARRALEIVRRTERMDEHDVAVAAADELRGYCERHRVEGLLLPHELAVRTAP